MCEFCILDMDECVVGFYNCYRDVICENIVGLFRCKCKLGFDCIYEGK